MESSTTRNGPECRYWDYSECEGTPYCPPRCPRFVDGKGVALLVRRYEDGDFEALVEMYEALDLANRTMGIPPKNPDRLRRWLRGLIDKGWHKIALDGERIVGHVGVAPAAASDPQLVAFVLDGYQGRGVGTELVKHAVASAADRGHAALTLDVSKGNRPAIAVYQNVGFEVTEEDAAELAMGLALDDPVAERVQRPPAER